MGINTVDFWELGFNAGGGDIILTSDTEPEMVTFGVETFVKIKSGLNVRYIRTQEMLGFSIRPVTKES